MTIWNKENETWELKNAIDITNDPIKFLIYIIK